VRTPPPKVLLPDKLWRLKFTDDSRLLPDFVLYALRCRAVRREIEIRASGTSGSMKNISKEDTAALRLPIPPLPVQEQFAALVARHERLRSVQRESLRQSEHLFQSLLHRAFSETN
jgi:type I restriction enzyme S subunit